MNIFEAAAELPDELRTALDDITHAIEKRTNAERAAIANLSAITNGERRIAELEASSKELDALAVKAEAMVSTGGMPKGDTTKAVKAADKAAAELADERRANERRVAAAALLDAEARSVDESIPALKRQLDAAVLTYSKQLLAAANEELLAACAPLIPVIQSIAAINALMPNRGLARDWLECAKLISPVGYRSDHLSGHVRVLGTDLLATDAPLPVLPADTASAIQELIAASKALTSYRKYVPPKPAPQERMRSPSEQKRYDEQAERIRRSEEEFDQRQANGKETYIPANRRGWVQEVREPGTPAPRYSGSAIDLDGSISDEWNRIGVGENVRP